MRAKFVNEKFTEESDPIADMGIGLRGVYNNLKSGDVFRLKKSLPKFENRNYVKGHLIRLIDVREHPRESYDKVVWYNFINRKGNEIFAAKNYQPWSWSYDFFKEYFEPVNLENLK